MKLKQKTITMIMFVFAVTALGAMFNTSTAFALPEDLTEWGQGVDCSETSDASGCTSFQMTCYNTYPRSNVFKERCVTAGYEYDSEGKLVNGEAEAPSLSTEACNESPAGCDPSGEDEEEKCEDLKTSILNVDSLCKDEDGPIFGLLKWVLRIMTAGVGVAAVGGIAWGALLYTTAENKPEQTKKAISIITNVVIGIVAYALMAVLLNFLIPGGIIG